MKGLAYGGPEFQANVAAWVGERLSIPLEAFGSYAATAVVRDGDIIAGVVWHNYREHMIEVSVAANDARWATPRILGGLLAYPFQQLGVSRLQAIVRRRNARSRRFVEGIGFKYEGKARRGWDGRQDAVIYSMLPDEAAKWLERVKNG